MKKRPAETAAALVGTGGVAAAIAAHDWLALSIACIGYLPAAVTFIVGHGGVRGSLRLLWSGKRR